MCGKRKVVVSSLVFNWLIRKSLKEKSRVYHSKECLRLVVRMQFRSEKRSNGKF
jgi:hypothetical protein